MYLFGDLNSATAPFFAHSTICVNFNQISTFTIFSALSRAKKTYTYDTLYLDKPARLTIRVLLFLFLIVRRVPRPSESSKKCRNIAVPQTLSWLQQIWHKKRERNTCLPKFEEINESPFIFEGVFRHFLLSLSEKNHHHGGFHGHRIADNRFQENVWPKRYFLRPLHFLHPLSEGRGTRLTIRNKDQRTLIVRRAGLSRLKLWTIFFFAIIFWMRKMKIISILHFFEFYSYLQRTPVLPNLITFDSSSNNLDNPVKNVLYRREDSVNVWRWVDALHQV